MDLKSQIPGWVKPAVWGGVVGAVAFAIIGVSAGWLVTSGAADQRAKHEAEKAVISSLAPICVAQFKKISQSEQTTHLAALQEESSWEQGDYVEERGWATFPGSNEPNDAVAEACSEQLLKVANGNSSK